MTKEGTESKFDWQILDAMLQFKPKLRFCADYMGVHENTIKDRIKKEKGLTFTEYRDQKMARVKISLMQKAVRMAQDGNTTMMIFCLKNLCGWADKAETTVEATITPAFEIVDYVEHPPEEDSAIQKTA